MLSSKPRTPHRSFNIKDFGDSIPGHGGVTDRFDCQVVMAVFSYIYFQVGPFRRSLVEPAAGCCCLLACQVVMAVFSYIYFQVMCLLYVLLLGLPGRRGRLFLHLLPGGRCASSW